LTKKLTEQSQEIVALRAENAELKAAQAALPEQLGAMVRNEVVKHCTEKLKDTLRDVIVQQAQPIIRTQADHILNGLHSTVQTLTTDVNDLKVSNASKASVSRPTKSSGFTSVSGVRFDIVDVPASYNYDKVKDALADFFELPKGDEFPRGVIGKLHRVFVSHDTDFSIWKFYLYSEDLMSYMHDQPYIRVTAAAKTSAGDSNADAAAAPTSRKAKIYPSEPDEMEALHRARKPIYNQISALRIYKVHYRRTPSPYAFDTATRKHLPIVFNEDNTAAEFNGETYRVTTDPQSAGGPSKSGGVPK